MIEPTTEDARNLGFKDAEDAARVVRDKLSRSSRGTPAVPLAPPGLIATGLSARLHEITHWSEGLRREYWVSLGSGLRLTEVALVEVEEPAGFWGVDLRKWERITEPFELAPGQFLTAPNPFYGWRRRGRFARAWHLLRTGFRGAPAHRSS